MEINVIGSQRELFPKHLFLVHVDPAWSAGFQKCSELSYEIAKIEYWEGGSIIPWKVPGRVTVADITLERGASKSKSFYLWCLQVANATITRFPTRGRGDKVPGYLKQIEIVQMDRDADENKPVAKYRLHNAWVQKFVAGEWDNTTDEVVIESLTVSFDFFTREPI
jgi:phage tail-like protein